MLNHKEWFEAYVFQDFPITKVLLWLFKCLYNRVTLINVPQQFCQMSHISYVIQNKTRKKLQPNILRINKQTNKQTRTAKLCKFSENNYNLLWPLDSNSDSSPFAQSASKPNSSICYLRL